ncbi:unnamed protein product [Meganyctiphanes norvegica]|uniref:Uncharacterized protein n=1 Tax=Meganyctiphanes norvegica TaxID=48144 RepID=A0AAV2RBG1_MEGNR
MVWKVDSDVTMEPPIQMEYLRSGGAITLIFRVGAEASVTSFWTRSAIPAYMVVPPDRMMLEKRSFLMSISQALTQVHIDSWMPTDSMPIMAGLKRTSGQRKRSLPMVMTWPSGSS